jgi:hypothetical protein
MLKPYTKNMYRTLFGDERYHAYGYGFAKGFKKTAPEELEFTAIVFTSSITALFGLIIGGPIVGLAAGLIAALAVHYLYEDVAALAGAYEGKKRFAEAKSEAPMATAFASFFLGNTVSEAAGEIRGELAGKGEYIRDGLFTP